MVSSGLVPSRRVCLQEKACVRLTKASGEAGPGFCHPASLHLSRDSSRKRRGPSVFVQIQPTSSLGSHDLESSPTRFREVGHSQKPPLSTGQSPFPLWRLLFLSASRRREIGRAPRLNSS